MNTPINLAVVWAWVWVWGLVLVLVLVLVLMLALAGQCPSESERVTKPTRQFERVLDASMA